MKSKRRSLALKNITEEPSSPMKSSAESGTAGEDEDALSSYERIESQPDKENAVGMEVYGFRTPVKRNQMAERVAQELLSRKGGSPRCSPSKTPGKSAQKETPACINTPVAFRRRVAQRLQKRPTEDSSSESESSAEEEEDESGPPSKQTTPSKKSRASSNTMDQYFEAQDGPERTSDRTLSRLKTPRLSHEALRTILSAEKNPYEPEIQGIISLNRSRFPKWNTVLREGFNIVTFGLGSKRDLLMEFMECVIAPSHDCVVVNGFFPSLTIKQVLNNITGDILGHTGALVSVPEHTDYILTHLKEPLYLIVHNIDGPNLRGEKNQSVLALLAAHPLVHLLCSIDHINAPIIWDQKNLSKFNFIWYETTTFLPYTQETLNENSIMVQESNALALSSLAAVFASLTPNAKSIFIIIAEDQLQAGSEASADYSGISFPTLYQRSREAFLVNSDITLRAQLTEFKDHKLIRIKKAFDGMDHLTIPLNEAALKDFIDDQKALP